MQTGMEKNLFGSHPVSLSTESRSPPPAFASDPLVGVSPSGGRDTSPSVGNDGTNITGGPSKHTVSEIMEIDGPSPTGNFLKSSTPVGLKDFLLLIPRQEFKSYFYASMYQSRSHVIS